MSKARVYTRRGDGGVTSLASGQRVSKCSPRLEAYGTVDELGSQLGLLITYLTDAADREVVEGLQRALFHVSAILASETGGTWMPQPFPAEKVEELEAVIDELESALPPLRAFVLTGGCRAAAVAHVCRTVCRRAERRVVELFQSLQDTDLPSVPLDPVLLSFLNRMSDYIFLLARKLNKMAGVEEKII